MIRSVDFAGFGEYVQESKGLVIVNFWTPWSDECRHMSSLMAGLQHLLDERDSIVQVDWDQEIQLVRKMEILGVPTLLIFARGKEVARYYGTMSEGELENCVVEAKRSEEHKNIRPYPNEASPTKRRT